MEFELIPHIEAGRLANVHLSAEILAKNEESAQYGLTLTESEAAMLVEAGREALVKHERIEFGKSAVLKLLEQFMHSTYIDPSDYAETMAALTDIFYELKSECRDAYADEGIVKLMFCLFEDVCGGSIDTLESMAIETVRRQMLGANEENNDDEEEENIDD